MKKKIFIICLAFIAQLSNAQNTCVDALPISAGLHTVSTIDGTNISTTCSTPTMAEWYRYTPTANYTVTISSDLIQNICKDTDFEVYTGSCAGLVCYSGDDDGGNIACNTGNTSSFLSVASFNVVAGNTYYIAWTNRWNPAGFDFQLTENPVGVNPCSTATLITAGITTVNAIDGQNLNTTCSTATLAKWYSYTPTANYNVTVTSDLTQNICKNTNFSIYTGSCTGTLTCVTNDDDSGIIACNSGNTNSLLSTASFTALMGTTYYIVWDNRYQNTGFDFRLTEVLPPPPPVVFVPQTISSTSGICCVVDMNNDYLDDIVTIQGNLLTILKQNSTGGGFTASTQSFTSLSARPDWSIAAGDFDKNGYTDLALGGTGSLSVIKANATGTAYVEIPYPQYIFSQRTNFVDINNDGNLDLFACHDTAQSHAYRNDGLGNLNFDISLMPTLALGGNYQSQWSDIDNDGDIDMYLSKCAGGAAVGDPKRINLLYKNNGNGTYTESGVTAGVNDGSQSWSSAIEDFDNDGDMDILISNISDTNKLYRNNNDGTFTDVFSTTGIAAQVGSWELQAADFNNDGLIDFLWQNAKELYINNGNLTFTGYDLGFSEGAIGDLNSDGFLDVQYNNVVYMNTPNANKWLTITLRGIQSNRNGIGARIEIYGPWGKQIREIKSGNGFSHQSTLNAHFGLGNATAITSIVIKWPSGTVDTINNPSVNSIVNVVEGATLATSSFELLNVSLYPNPNNGDFKIHTNEICNIEIYDILGQKVYSQSEVQNDIDIKANLKTGVYFVKINSEEKTATNKIIVE